MLLELSSRFVLLCSEVDPAHVMDKLVYVQRKVTCICPSNMSGDRSANYYNCDCNVSDRVKEEFNKKPLKLHTLIPNTQYVNSNTIYMVSLATFTKVVLYMKLMITHYVKMDVRKVHVIMTSLN